MGQQRRGGARPTWAESVFVIGAPSACSTCSTYCQAVGPTTGNFFVAVPESHQPNCKAGRTTRMLPRKVPNEVYLGAVRSEFNGPLGP